MFLAARNKIDYFHRLDDLEGEELGDWLRRIEVNRRFVERRGSHYGILVAPNKETIYPQFMPKGYRQVGEKSRLEVLREALPSETLFVDPTQVLINASSDDQLYAKTDVHWNGVGAFLAYEQLIRALNRWYPDLEPLSREQLVSYREPGNFDLMRQAALEPFSRETWELLRPERGWTAATSGPEERVKGLTLGGQPTYTENEAGYPLHVLVLHDSFGQQLKPFMAETFARTSFLHHRYYTARNVQGESMAALIERLKPDVVIHEATERVFIFGASGFPSYPSRDR
jgi:hypothetical protein